MDFATLLGILSGLGLIGWAMWSYAQEQAVNMFLSIPSLAIVLGGTLAATLLSFPLKEVFRIFRIMGVVFKKERDSMSPFIDEIVDLADTSRKSMKELENSVSDVSHPFLRDGIQMVVDGYNEPELRDIMMTRIENRAKRERGEANVLKTMGKFSPAFGMIGTLIGLVVMLYSMGEGATADAAAQLGVGMGAALITTFYGVLLANLFFNPMAEKFESRIRKENTLQQMLIEGTVQVLHRKHPLIVREKLNSFIPPREWKKPGEENN
ncbi:MAG: MotA/TolQ/ExbB proton channel family protein [Candidatus Marinimicrobia bacterium]|nr:MotA/TolQ/ExbB proton channel family protein [Candidatus Neomarinimicrobiota bacterium]MCF7827817.1 MotA/TolQ/ExbB proton channel family protein [Candidatus Neomarinimicrobiota bacterium]MCF7879428.1 MotA/TolQ/ExbB proton channel family protein [Candidatus Neomarinimicrobiota bacterium]